LPADANGLRNFYAEILIASDLPTTQKRLAQNFLSVYKNSMFNEFMNHFAE
jgi:hypothetical protein